MEETLLENLFFLWKKCIILFQLSMYSLLLHPKSLLSSFWSLKGSSVQNQEFEKLISLNCLSKPARSHKQTNFFLKKEITRHSGIENSFLGLYIHKKNGNLPKNCVWSCCCEIILRTRNCHHKFIKNLLPEKRKENMKTKQPRFKSRLNWSN